MATSFAIAGAPDAQRGREVPGGTRHRAPGKWRRFVVVAVGLGAIIAGAQGASAIDLRVQPSLLGQVRKNYWSGDTEAPVEIYGDLGASRLPYGATIDTYFRLEQDFGPN